MRSGLGMYGQAAHQLLHTGTEIPGDPERGGEGGPAPTGEDSRNGGRVQVRRPGDFIAPELPVSYRNDPTFHVVEVNPGGALSQLLRSTLWSLVLSANGRKGLRPAYGFLFTAPYFTDFARTQV